MASFVNNLRTKRQKERLAREYAQSDTEYAQSLLAAHRRQTPSALIGVEPSLQGGFQLGEVSGVPISLTDIIPAEAGANTLASLGKIGAAKLGTVPALAGIAAGKTDDIAKLIKEVEDARALYELQRAQRMQQMNQPSNALRNIAVGAGALGAGTTAGYYGMGMVE